SSKKRTVEDSTIFTNLTHALHTLLSTHIKCQEYFGSHLTDLNIRRIYLNIHSIHPPSHLLKI
ncbi:hypothetical protein J6590_017190, partial [Homalodisca vitripennis]